MASVFIQIAGIRHLNDDGTSRIEIASQMTKGRKLYFVDAACEEYPTAIKVLNREKKQLGYVPDKYTEYLRTIESDVTKYDVKLNDSWILRNGNEPFVEMKVAHPDLPGNSIGRFTTAYGGWDKVRDTLGISYDEKVTSADIERYMRICAGKERAPIVSQVTKQPTRRTETIDVNLDFLEYSGRNVRNEHRKAGCLATLSMVLMICIAIILMLVLVL